MSPIIIAIVILALLYAFLNGRNDSSSIVATMISSRALSPRAALLITAVAEFLGPFIFGIAVAKTIGHGIVQAELISTTVILAAMLSAVAWNLLTGYLGLPSSSSHALIGGLIGAVVMGAGWQAIQISGLEKTLIPLFVAPLIGFGIGFIVLRIIMRLSWDASPSINENFKRNQIFTVIVLALSHGSNDAPKAMGMITLALITGSYLNTFVVPTWVILMCALAISAGTAVGAQRLIRTVGAKFYKIAPMDAFSAQLASAIVVLTASLTGGPVSASQVISTAIMGVGAAERPNKVRWKIASDIGTTWLLTIPATALLAALVYILLTRSIQ
ncbi:MAG: inorganic phosphate transporter [Anaerolineales bacterium]